MAKKSNKPLDNDQVIDPIQEESDIPADAAGVEKQCIYCHGVFFTENDNLHGCKLEQEMTELREKTDTAVSLLNIAIEEFMRSLYEGVVAPLDPEHSIISVKRFEVALRNVQKKLIEAQA